MVKVVVLPHETRTHLRPVVVLTEAADGGWELHRVRLAGLCPRSVQQRGNERVQLLIATEQKRNGEDI